MADHGNEAQAEPIPAPPPPPPDPILAQNVAGLIFAIRIGCMLHVLHLAVCAGMECEFFMGPLGKGSWHEWEDHHLVALLGSLWYNTSRSDSSCISWKRLRYLIMAVFGVAWRTKFIRPAGTRWMVVWDAAAWLDERWEQVVWLHLDWAAHELLKTPFMDYWFKALCMLTNPLIRVHAKFCVALKKNILGWAYNWIRGEGGYFLKGPGGAAERLPPGHRWAELATFCLVWESRLEELRANPEKYFGDVLEVATETLSEDELQHFLQNFEEGEGGFFTECMARFSKWADMHHHLPYSIATLACSSFYDGKWVGSEKAFEYAVGQEFARALLKALWPEMYQSQEWAEWEEANDFLAILKEDLEETTTTREKDELTLGLFSKLNESSDFRAEIEEYAASAHEKKEVASDDGDEENPSPCQSGFRPIWTFPLLYEWSCHTIYFALIHQQLVESVFSKYDTCTKPHDSREIDLVRLGQFKSKQSRIERLDASPKEIREAGDKAVADARSLKKVASEATPNERQLRKRDHDASAFLLGVNEAAEGKPVWTTRGLMPLSDSERSDSEESSESEELSSGDDERSSGDDEQSSGDDERSSGGDHEE